MTQPSFALQGALIAALAADAPLTALLGGAHIYESVPPSRQPPWIHVDEVTARENDTSSDAGHIHRITLACVSRQPGIKECSALAERVATVLGNASLTLNGHRLINLTVSDTSLRRSGKHPTRIMNVRLRAVTERL